MNRLDLSQYKGMSQASAMFGFYLADHADEYPMLNVLSADMSVAASLDKFIYEHPDKFTEVGISEQNLVGVAAGLASEGYLPIAIAQAAFITMRAFEMDRQYLGYMKNNVKLVGLNSGFYLQYFANTHYNIEDLALMREIPNMTVLSPADAGEAVMALQASLIHEGPVYIRLSGGAQAPTVYPKSCDFEIGKTNVLTEGNDVSIFATGAMVGYCMQTVEVLKSQRISARLVDVHTIKPLDVDIIKASKNSKLLVSVEEHNIIGGLGTAISDFISGEGGYPALLKLGVKDKFSKPGDYQYLLHQHRLTPELIAEDIINSYKKL